MKTDDKPETICGYTLDEALDRTRQNTGYTPWSVVKIWRFLCMCRVGASAAEISASVGFSECDVSRVASRLGLPLFRQWSYDNDGVALALEQRRLSAEDIARPMLRHPRDVRERLAFLRERRSIQLEGVAA